MLYNFATHTERQLLNLLSLSNTITSMLDADRMYSYIKTLCNINKMKLPLRDLQFDHRLNSDGIHSIMKQVGKGHIGTLHVNKIILTVIRSPRLNRMVTGMQILAWFMLTEYHYTRVLHTQEIRPQQNQFAALISIDCNFNQYCCRIFCLYVRLNKFQISYNSLGSFHSSDVSMLREYLIIIGLFR